MSDPASVPRRDWMAIVASLLLCGYFGFACYALLSPSNDPQRGMAEGFAVLVALVFLSLGFLLWLGVRRRRRWLVRLIFAIAILPALSPIARLIYVIFRPAVAA